MHNLLPRLHRSILPSWSSSSKLMDAIILHKHYAHKLPKQHHRPIIVVKVDVTILQNTVQMHTRYYSKKKKINSCTSIQFKESECNYDSLKFSQLVCVANLCPTWEINQVFYYERVQDWITSKQIKVLACSLSFLNISFVSSGINTLKTVV
jgi:hypothetical protein